MRPDETPRSGDLEYALGEFKNLRDQAMRDGQPFDPEAALTALAAKTGLTLAKLKEHIPVKG
jgi:hypothetical protein